MAAMLAASALQDPKTQSNIKTVLIVAAVLVVVLILGLVIGFVASSSASKHTNNNGTTSKGKSGKHKK
jgi:hypothetical protein